MTTTTETDRGTGATMEKVFEIYIRATPERLWEAITDPDLRSKYTFGTRIHTDWTLGARVEVDSPESRRASKRGGDSRSRPTAPSGSDIEGAVEL